MRKDTRLYVGVSGMAMLLVFCGIAGAQSPSSSPPNLSLLIGDRIEIIDEDRSVLTGKLLRVSEASVVIEVDRKPKEVQVHRIREMSRWDEDSVADGILIGTSLGFLIPALISGAIDTGEPGEAAAMLIPPGLGIGMAVGWIVDALRHTKIQISPATPSRVAVVPMLGRGRKGVAASLRF
jgi:hypothetical protein